MFKCYALSSGAHTALTVIFKSHSRIRRYAVLYAVSIAYPAPACTSTGARYISSNSPDRLYSGKIIGCPTRTCLKSNGSFGWIPLVAMADGLPSSAAIHPGCAGVHYPCIDVDTVP